MVIRKLNKFFNFETDKQEKYYETMAQNGYFYVKENRFYTKFVKGEPKSLKFTVLPNCDYYKSNNIDVNSLYNQAGYDTVSFDPNLIFSIKKENEVKVLDEEIILQVKEEKLMSEIYTNIFMLVAIILLFGLLLYGSGTAYRILITTIAIVFSSLLIFLKSGFFPLLMYYNNLKHKKFKIYNFKLFYYFSKICGVLIVFLSLYLIIIDYNPSINGQNVNKFEHLFIKSSDLSGKQNNYFNSNFKKNNIIYYSIEAISYDTQNPPLSVYGRIYICRFNWIASMLFDDMIINSQKNMQLDKEESKVLDKVYIYTNDDYNWHFVYAIKDNVIYRYQFYNYLPNNIIDVMESKITD